MEVLIAFLSFFAVSFGMYYMFITARNRERLALIEKGADASLFYAAKETGTGISFGKVFSALKIGLFFIGIGLGIAMGYFVSLTGMDEGASYTSMIFLFGGLGLVVYYLISRNRE